MSGDSSELDNVLEYATKLSVLLRALVMAVNAERPLDSTGKMKSEYRDRMWQGASPILDAALAIAVIHDRKPTSR